MHFEYTDGDVLRWALDIAKAMHYLHTRQPMIIHRDLKVRSAWQTRLLHPAPLALRPARRCLARPCSVLSARSACSAVPGVPRPPADPGLAAACCVQLENVLLDCASPCLPCSI